MALPYKKDLDKYRDMDEDELLNKLSAEELKQLETALEEIDPEVSQEHSAGGGLPVADRFIDKMPDIQKWKKMCIFEFVYLIFAVDFGSHCYAQ